MAATKATRRKICCASTLVSGAVLSGIALVLLGVAYRPFNGLVGDVIAWQVKLTNGSTAEQSWSTTKVPTYNVYYVFNITNVDEYLHSNGSVRPYVDELGPFVYQEYKNKIDLHWSEDESTVTYNKNTTYVFRGNMSCGDPKKLKITTVNLPLLGLVIKLSSIPNISEAFKEDIGKIEEALYEHFKEKDPMFISNRTIDELLWGYNDTLLDYLMTLPLVKSILKTSFFSLQNRSSISYNNTVKTGKHNESEVAQYVRWNNVTEIGGWGTPTARMINGTEGILFHPGVKKDKVMVFIDEIYRSGYLTYNGTASIQGIMYYKFVIPHEELDNKTQDPGFYPSGVPTGVLNMTSVATTLNVPLFASKPNFLGADKIYLHRVHGMEPNSTLHDSIIGIEPLTGAVVDAHKKLQLNILLRRYEYMVPYSSLPDEEVMIPIFWASEQGTITPSLANEFKKTVYGAKYGLVGAFFVVLGIAGLVFVVCVMCLTGMLVRHYKQNYSSEARERQTINYSERTPILTATAAKTDTTPEL